MSNEAHVTPGAINSSAPLMERVELIRTLADIVRGGFGASVSGLASEKLIEQLKTL